MIFFFYNILNILALLIAYALNPIVALFVDEDGYLPKCLFWFATPDSNMFGYKGDMGFYESHRTKTNTWLGRVMTCCAWMYRNTAQGFREDVLGYRRHDGDVLDIVSGASDKCSWDKSTCGWAFQYHGSYFWSDTKRFRWNIGWKLNALSKRDVAMIVFSISPYINR